MQETDTPATDNSEAERRAREIARLAKEDNRPNPLSLPCLDENPYTSKKIFSDTASYIKNAPQHTDSDCRKANLTNRQNKAVK
ncbi:MAG: hypothetical protein MJZ77_03020 [Bacteroidales bacterium]|nr:hypothetical protein [Bacteroidales bacterium]